MTRLRTLVYKRTHNGDPCPETGIFGNHDCMRGVRGWKYDAIIGVGGIGPMAEREGIARKLTWIGIGPQIVDKRHLLVAFQHFKYYGPKGPPLEVEYKALARRMYSGGVRVIIDGLTAAERADVDRILALAKKAAPSVAFRQTTPDNKSEAPTSVKCSACGRKHPAKAVKSARQVTMKQGKRRSCSAAVVP